MNFKKAWKTYLNIFYNSLVGQVKDILDTGTVTPAVNQVECHAFFNQRKLKAFLDERNITLGRAVGTIFSQA